MSDKIELNCFPSSKGEALAMLYLQKQDFTNLSPRNLVNKYEEVLEEIKEQFGQNASARYLSR